MGQDIPAIVGHQVVVQRHSGEDLQRLSELRGIGSHPRLAAKLAIRRRRQRMDPRSQGSSSRAQRKKYRCRWDATSMMKFTQWACLANNIRQPSFVDGVALTFLWVVYYTGPFSFWGI